MSFLFSMAKPLARSALRMGHSGMRRGGPRPEQSKFLPSRLLRPRPTAATATAARGAHTVRVIVTSDVSRGSGLYAGDVATVSAGYARNYLIPQRLAVYATRLNFAQRGLADPALETADARRARLEREALAGDDKDLKMADVLRVYLRNKVVRCVCD